MYTSCIIFTYIYNVNNINTMCIIYNMYIYVYIYKYIYIPPTAQKEPANKWLSCVCLLSKLLNVCF